MSQNFMQNPRSPLRVVASTQTVSVAASGNTTLLDLIVVGVEKLSFQVDVATQALDAFIVKGRVHADATLVTLASAASDFTSPTRRILAASGDMTTIAAGSSGWFDMDVSGLHSVQVLASAATGTAAVSIYASGSAGGSNVPMTSQGMAVTGNGFTSAVSVTRTNDTNAYTAGDVIGTGTGASGAVLTFANIGAASGHIMVTDADYRVDLTAVPASMTSFRLHLYDASPASALGDNAAWDLPSGDRANYLGYIDLGTPVDVGSTLFVQTSIVNKKLKMPAGTSLYGYLVTNGGYTPTAQAVQQVRLNAVGI